MVVNTFGTMARVWLHSSELCRNVLVRRDSLELFVYIPVNNVALLTDSADSIIPALGLFPNSLTTF